MLDANPASITKLGKVTIHGNPKPGQNRIVVRGFSGNGTTCRDISALALVWAIGELQRELMETLKAPGGGDVGVD